MFLVKSFRIILQAFRQWGTNSDSRLGAATAYYTLFSITPLFVLSITLAGWFFGEEKARENAYDWLRHTVDAETAESIKTLIEHAQKPLDASGPAIIGLALLVAGALGLFVNVRAALCTIWKLEPPRGNTYLGVLLDYSLALVMVFVTGCLLLASLIISTVLPLFVRWVNANLPEGHVHWRFVEMGVSLVLLTLVFAATYRILSGNRIPWGYVWYGSLIASLLFTVGKTLMGYYLLYFSPASAYGAAGSIFVFLLWVYYSSLILFFGAELIQARRTRHEWLAKPGPP